MDKCYAYRTTFLILFFLISIVVVISNSYIPYCFISMHEESLLRSVFFALVGVIFFLGIYCWKKSLEKKEKDFKDLLFFVIPIVLAAPIAWSTMSREHTLEIHNWEFNGVVSNKFRSTNHFSRAITVNEKNYEFIPAKIWSAVSVGDKIVKQPCSSTISINGNDKSFIIEWD